MQRVGILNGENITQDKDFAMYYFATANEGIIEGLNVTANNVALGKAIIKGTRTNGEIVAITFENTDNVIIDTSGTTKVFIEINQANLDDGSTNAEDGTGVAEIKTSASFPSGNYIALASVVSGVITDERIFGTARLKRKGLTPNRLFYTDSNGDEQELGFGTAGQVLTGLGIDTTPTWEVPASGDITGVVKQWAGTTAPTGYFMCDGQAVSRTTYANLFGIIGTLYGTGDGSTTFNVPNLKGKTIVGFNSAETEFDTLGKTGGAKTHTLDITEIPAHTHTYHHGAYNYGAGYEGAQYGGQTSNTGSAGGGLAHNNLQPYITLNNIIKF